MSEGRVRVGVIGGSGLYRLAATHAPRAVTTPYGSPSGELSIGTVAGVGVAFLPRHGSGHSVPPHRINHRANLWALQSLGVERVIAASAVGSLRADMAPGEVVLCDQFIDHSGGVHQTTFFDGPEVAHVSLADPYCAELRRLAAQSCSAQGFRVHPAGTVVVVAGPRFSTRAESRRFRAEGGDVINMTQFPEVALARELGMCYANLSLVTDYDAGLDNDPGIEPVTQDQVMTRFAEHTIRLHKALERLVGIAGDEGSCGCAALRAVPLGH